MKSNHNPLFFRKNAPCATILPMGTGLIALAVSTALGASDSWIPGTSGAYATPANWNGGNVPNGATDIATVEGGGSIVAFNDTVSLQSLNLALSSTGGTPTFNQTGGTLSLSGLAFGGSGQSRNPTYNMDGGTLNISTSFNWSNGNNARFNQSAGTVNHNGGFLSIGVAGGSRGHITMTGGEFNANSVTQVNLGNTSSGNGQANINLSGAAVFNATAATLVVGQLGAATGTNSFGTVTLAGTSALNASTIVVGGNNAASAVFGVINLNGGTVSAGSIRKGNSNIAAGITQNVLHANGGTVRAISHANNSNYFQNLFVDIQSGGLNFDTNGNNIGIPTNMSGDGGLTKKGAGTLTFTGTNTYLGLTTVETGTLVNNGSLAGPVTVAAGGTLAGTGTVAGTAAINGNLTTGNSPGEIGFGGDLTLSGTATIKLGGSAAAGVDYDFLSVAETIILGGTLDITSHDSYDLTIAAAYNLFDAENVEGNFTSVSVGGFSLTYDGNLDTWNGISGSTTYQFLESNGVLTVIPEPSSALLGTIGIIALLRRRR